MHLWITGLVDIYAIVGIENESHSLAKNTSTGRCGHVGHPVYHFHQINQSTYRPLYQEGDTITIEISALIKD